ncbi:hypothetical protein GGQ80_001732 [Sphingomonas jinjuensis]|uniref:Uncharacterized protein n=1 Tax=Sphingomonas jinjuensis TaxID=535907 RepID=A0A840FC55_9SPHN|nr:hypothetical protein [Sphingomonas jinjuensis]MBB4153826.1 hypothetical protein [Sphingomonas jinjuensis]
MKLRHLLGAAVVIAAMWPRAAGRGSTRRPPRRPGAGEESAPVTSPRDPTLSGGAAASLDA